MLHVLLALLAAVLGGAPHGASSDVGSTWDPNGASPDVGNTWDPNG